MDYLIICKFAGHAQVKSTGEWSHEEGFFNWSIYDNTLLPSLR